MGSGRFTANDWDRYASRNVTNKTATTGASGIYTSSSLAQSLDPKGVNRESRDSVDNPNSTAVLIGLDVTGSMQHVLSAMMRTSLPTLAKEIYDRKPISDPHLAFMGIGDALCDRSPFQVTQFEADIRIAEQLKEIWLEEGGGGNGEEGYALAYYFADRHTSIDCFEKHDRKGFLFTIGNDGPTTKVSRRHAKEIFGDDISEDITGEALLKQVSRKYEVFHLHLTDSYGSEQVFKKWRDLLGERAIKLTDHTKMAEVIVSLLQVLAGEDKDKVTKSWDGSTGLVVATAISDITQVSKGGGLAKF